MGEGGWGREPKRIGCRRDVSGGRGREPRRIGMSRRDMSGGGVGSQEG